MTSSVRCLCLRGHTILGQINFVMILNSRTSFLALFTLYIEVLTRVIQPDNIAFNECLNTPM